MVAQQRVETTIAGPRSTVLVAQESGRLVGFATVYLDLLSVRFGQRAWLEDLAVDPQSRSLGVGNALLAAARDWAREQGAQRLGLQSGLGRVDAHRFYEREQPDYQARSFIWQL